MENMTASKNVDRLAETTLKQLSGFKEVLKIHLRAVSEQRTKHPHGKAHAISEDALDILFKKSEEIRESGELLNFNIFSCAVDQIEKLLGKLRTPVQYRRTDIIGDLLTVLENLEHSIRS